MLKSWTENRKVEDLGDGIAGAKPSLNATFWAPFRLEPPPPSMSVCSAGAGSVAVTDDASCKQSRRHSFPLKDPSLLSSSSAAAALLFVYEA